MSKDLAPEGLRARPNQRLGTGRGNKRGKLSTFHKSHTARIVVVLITTMYCQLLRKKCYQAYM